MLILLGSSLSAFAQQQLPSGAVRSHYAKQGAIPAVREQTPVYAPAAPASSHQPIAPVAHETHIPEPGPLPTRGPAPAPILITPRGSTSPKALVRTPTSGWGALSSVGASLGLVLGAFLCVAMLSKRYLPKAAGPLPKEVVEQLGWAPLVGRQQMQLVRLGNKLLLISVTPGSSAEPLAEVTDPAEVERLSAMCRRAKPESSTQTFRDVISDLERQPTRGFVETQPRPVTPRPATTTTPISTTTPQRPVIARPLNG
ncbi:FliO/MopB family protein [Anatilimnocola floriformis]|uniref:FliO/MopB family protein n=1 Tax=Anatilimnocola floriformis TaxID=2948575 RepID=UPI0020C437E6|nr:flagellar biosynthetic protein FliO [Anatilimnocola floriformis]